jgi:pimeloyl-ACP methyl ester carboxylesterase
MPAVAVLVPGIFGSELSLNGQLIWPGPIRSLIFPYRLMNELLDPNTVSTDVIRRYAITVQYEAILDDLNGLGFHENNGTLIAFHYDWRKANETSAAALADRLDQTLAAMPTATFHLIGHSMGGLVSRYYLESGTFDARPAFAKVATLLTLGTPHRGAPLALHRILGQEKALWLSAAQIRQAANDPRYPSAYQLLPPPGEPFAWDQTFAGVDIYDEALAPGRGLSIAGLRAAKAFYAGLDPSKRPAHVRYFCYSGTRLTTNTNSLARTGTAFNPSKIERDDGGDGTVPFWSSALTGLPCLAIGGEHSALYKDRDVRLTMPTLLGVSGGVMPAMAMAATNAVQVAVRDKVVEPGQAVSMTLTPATPGQSMNGNLRVEKAQDMTDPATTYRRVGQPLPIRYRGPAVASFALVAHAPTKPGAYRFTFAPTGSTVPTGSDPFLVQRTT